MVYLGFTMHLFVLPLEELDISLRQILQKNINITSNKYVKHDNNTTWCNS